MTIPAFGSKIEIAMKNKFILLILAFSFLASGLPKGWADEDEYLRAKSFVKSGDKDFAFIKFLTIVNEKPNSRYRQQALFAVAEYYFTASDYIDAFEALRKFIQNYPDSQMRPFALVYLLKISQAWQKDSLAKNIESQIKNLKKVVLVFKDTKEEKFISPLGINHKIVYYIDRIQFYLDGKLQAQFYY